MRSKKSDNEGNTAKVSTSQPPKTKGVARTTKPKAGNTRNPRTLARPAEHENDAGTIQSLSDYPVFPSEEEMQARVAKRAYELYEQRGWQHGYDVADWCQAAKEVLVQKDVR